MTLTMFARTTRPPQNLYATRAMTRFQCIAEKCEDTCCGGMRIPLSQAELDRLTQAMSVDEEGKQLLQSAVSKEGLAEGQAAALHEEKGQCAMMDGRGLCRILTRGNPFTAMPEACVTFPRRFGVRTYDWVEVFGSCACPEAARLMLLADDGLDLVPAGPEVSGLYPNARFEYETPGPYYAATELVRAWGMERLLDPELPVGARLLGFMELGKLVDGFFHLQAKEQDPERLDAALYVAASPGTGETLRAAVSRAEPAALGTVLLALWGELRKRLGAPSRRLDRLLPPALERWGGEGAGAEALGRGYAAAVQALPPRAEVIFGRYCASDWQKEWYCGYPTVTERGRWLLARACAVRLAIAAHPALGEASADPAAVDAALIEAIQIAAKSFEHSRESTPAVLAALAREVPDPAEQALAMARFCA